MCSSCGVSSSRVSSLRLRTFSPVASSSCRARSANAVGADRQQLLAGDAQLLARVDPPALAAQPLAVEQMRAGELHAQARAPEALDRLAVAALGGVPLAGERADAGLDPQRPVAGRERPCARTSSRARPAAAPRRPVRDAASASSGTTNGV